MTLWIMRARSDRRTGYLACQLQSVAKLFVVGARSDQGRGYSMATMLIESS